jgi:hypothetical protein
VFDTGRRRSARQRIITVSMCALAAMVPVVGVPGPAQATTERAPATVAAVTPSGGWDCGLRCTYSLDRPTTQRWAQFFRRWDKLSDVPAIFVAQMLCATVPNRPASAACMATVTGGSAYFVDQLYEADAIGGCLRFRLFDLPGFDFARLDAHNDGNCVGARH